MEALVIIIAVLAGWCMRKAATEICEIRCRNRRKRAMQKKQMAHRASSWRQILAVGPKENLAVYRE